MKARDFDEKFDSGADVSDDVDWAKARRPNLEFKRVNVDFPARVVEAPGASASPGKRWSSSGSRSGWRGRRNHESEPRPYVAAAAEPRASNMQFMQVSPYSPKGNGFDFLGFPCRD
jgi:hypothetical protein